jgi:hypothetical protein
MCKPLKILASTLQKETHQTDIRYNFDVTGSTGNVRKMLFGVGSDKFDHRMRRNRMRVTAVKSSSAVKSGLRRMSTTFSLKSSSSRHETDRIDSGVVAVDRPKPRPQRPATGIIEWTETNSHEFDIE